MAGISSKALGGVVENKKGYNGNELQSKEFSDGSGLNAYDFNARTYDQQIGRFVQIDPEVDNFDQEKFSPFHFAENNPTSKNDPSGRCPTCPGFAPAIPWILEGIATAIEALAVMVTANEAGKQIAKTVNSSSSAGGEGIVSGSNFGVPTGTTFRRLYTKQAESKGDEKPKEIIIDGNKHPQSAEHGIDAEKSGSKVEGVVDRKGRDARRRENLDGKAKEQGKDRDEFPPAVIKTDGPVSVRLIDSKDNRGSGGSLGQQLKNIPDNTRIVIRIIPPKKS